MNRKIFLEGDIKVGKSFVVKEIINNLNPKYGGFKTVPIFNENKKIGYKIVDLMTNEEELVALYNFDGNLIINTKGFDNLGVKSLDNALKNSNLIVMDEIGFLEENSNLFKEKILEVLKSDKDVIAVIKEKKNNFLNEIIKFGKIYKVTNENRDNLIKTIIKELKDGYL